MWRAGQAALSRLPLAVRQAVERLGKEKRLPVALWHKGVVTALEVGGFVCGCVRATTLRMHARRLGW